MSYDPKVTRDSIEQLTEPLPQSTVFELLDAAFSGRSEQAFTLYKEQRALKIEPQAIMALVAWQLHVLAVVVAGKPQSAEEIAKAAKLNPFVVRKTQGLARRISMPQVKKLVADLLALDLQLKRAPIDADEALQLYLLKLSNI
jgi:DNA polymerase III delta subunit